MCSVWPTQPTTTRRSSIVPANSTSSAGGHHLAFGTGPHRCLGQALARTELRIVVDTLFRRIPGLRLESAVEELLFNDDPIAFGLYQLPVIW
ncbi:cytochrome P450 [Streptomyces sp. NPDC048277]|uniref:cytochrome P450 n=1 Tax=Streptomyces sp. NPDC048277 TaxID=3155027 RepID=UPI0033EE57A9